VIRFVVSSATTVPFLMCRTWKIAMQKVVGSNPIIRLSEDPDSSRRSLPSVV